MRPGRQQIQAGGLRWGGLRPDHCHLEDAEARWGIWEPFSQECVCVYRQNVKDTVVVVGCRGSKGKRLRRVSDCFRIP